MPAAIATPNLLSGAGYLFGAPLGSTLPANTVAASKFTDAWPVAWLPFGATAEGSTWSYEVSSEAMRVAELFDPVRYATTERTGSLAFALAAWNLTNLKRAMNGGTITTTGAAGAELNSYAMPTPGQETRLMLGWESEDSTVRLIVGQALSSGTIESAFQKAPDFSQIPTTWNMEVPAGGNGQPFQFFTAGTARA